jgi:hypothetical protein
MATSDTTPTQAEVRRILAAAADVLFSDGVPDAFLDQWAEETVFLLANDAVETAARRSRRHG